MKTRKEILSEITESLNRGLSGKNAYLKRKGNVFFRCGDAGCVQRDVVYYGSKRYGLNFELLSMDWHYFTGSHEHAMALKDAFGGKVYPSEYVSCVESMDLWIWEGPHREEQIKAAYHGKEVEPLDLDVVKRVLFDEEDCA